jgi:hypothetical protein
VLAQTYHDFEVVVSDDSGGTLAPVVEGFGDERLRHHANATRLGPASNLVAAVGHSRGRLIAILNDDDMWLSRFLEMTVGVLEAHPEVVLVFTDDWLEVGGQRLRRALPFAPGRIEEPLRAVLEHGMPASAALMRRELWDEGERTLPITAGMVGDATAWLRAAEAGRPFWYLAEPLGVLTLHRQQVSWSEAGLPSRMIATHEAFRFVDADCEALRRARLAEFLLARANALLRARRWGAAWGDIGRAHRTSPRPLGLRALLALLGLREVTVRAGIAHPAALVAVLRLWRRIRPRVMPRSTIGP